MNHFGIPFQSIFDNPMRRRIVTDEGELAVVSHREHERVYSIASVCRTMPMSQTSSTLSHTWTEESRRTKVTPCKHAIALGECFVWCSIWQGLLNVPFLSIAINFQDLEQGLQVLRHVLFLMSDFRPRFQMVDVLGHFYPPLKWCKT